MCRTVHRYWVYLTIFSVVALVSCVFLAWQTKRTTRHARARQEIMGLLPPAATKVARLRSKGPGTMETHLGVVAPLVPHHQKYKCKTLLRSLLAAAVIVAIAVHFQTTLMMGKNLSEAAISSTTLSSLSTFAASSSRRKVVKPDLPFTTGTRTPLVKNDQTRPQVAQPHLPPLQPSNDQPQPSSTTYKSRAIHFMNSSELDGSWDAFSASWLQHRDRFMEMNVPDIPGCEATAFEAWNRDWRMLRMTVDLLDFSVEHHSFYWKLLNDDDGSHDVIHAQFRNYIRQGLHFPTPTYPILAKTIAMIAFRPYAKKAYTITDVDRAHYRDRTTLSLAAAVESLRRAEMGRAIVVGQDKSDQAYADAAFGYLAANLPLQHTIVGNVTTKIGHMEVAFVLADKKKSWSKQAERNLPKGAVAGVRDALLLSELSECNLTQRRYVREWLGESHNASYWQYFYLTEPDQILVTRPSALRRIKMEVDLRNIVAPHRLQPIPHERDLNGTTNKYLTAKLGFGSIIRLDTFQDVCCDELRGRRVRPGKSNFADCGAKWFMCGLDRYKRNETDPLQRLRPYQFMTLSHGTGLVMLAATLQARRCVPAHNAYCSATPGQGHLLAASL